MSNSGNKFLTLNNANSPAFNGLTFKNKSRTANLSSLMFAFPYKQFRLWPSFNSLVRFSRDGISL